MLFLNIFFFAFSSLCVFSQFRSSSFYFFSVFLFVVRFLLDFFPVSMREQKETAISRRILLAFISFGVNYYLPVTTLRTEVSLFVRLMFRLEITHFTKSISGQAENFRNWRCQDLIKFFNETVTDLHTRSKTVDVSAFSTEILHHWKNRLSGTCIKAEPKVLVIT